MTRTLRTILTVLGALIVGTVILFAQATHLSTSGTLPTHCTPGDVYHKTGTGAGLYDCSATDTWTGPLSASTGSGTVTNTGTLTSGKTIVGNGTTDVTVSSLTANLVSSSSGTLAGAVASANSRFLGSTSSGSGAAYSEMSGTTATALLDAMVGDSGSGGTKGLVPAPASGDAAAGKFLKADGTFAVPAGGGGGSSGCVPLESHTASGGAALLFTTRNASGQSGATFQSDFDVYQLYLQEVLAASAETISIQVSTDGGSSYDSTSGHYGTSQFIWSSSGSTTGGGSVSTSIPIGALTGRTNSSSLPASGGPFLIVNPLGSNAKKIFGQGKTSGGDSVTSNVTQTMEITGAYLQSTAVNAFKVFMSGGGNITSGVASLCGRTK